MTLDDWISSETALLRLFAKEYQERWNASLEAALDLPRGRPSVLWKQEFERWLTEKDAMNTSSDDAP